MPKHIVNSIPERTNDTDRPPITEEAREQLNVALAMDLAEKQLREGTASSQVITHFLKIGSIKEHYEQQLLQMNIELAKAKTDLLKAQQQGEEKFNAALEAFKRYQGVVDDETEDDEYDQ